MVVPPTNTTVCIPCAFEEGCGYSLAVTRVGVVFISVVGQPVYICPCICVRKTSPQSATWNAWKHTIATTTTTTTVTTHIFSYNVRYAHVHANAGVVVVVVVIISSLWCVVRMSSNVGRGLAYSGPSVPPLPKGRLSKTHEGGQSCRFVRWVALSCLCGACIYDTMRTHTHSIHTFKVCCCVLVVGE